MPTRRHEATDLLELVEHGPNGAIRDVGRTNYALVGTAKADACASAQAVN